MRPRALILVAGATMAVTAVVWPRQVFPHETLTTTVLFEREIVRVLDKHCVMCHSAGGPAFPLTTYEETWLKGRSIRSAVIARHMPPWAAVPGYGAFANDNSLTLRETQFVVSWVEGLGPRNAGRIFLNVQDAGAPRPREVRAEPHFGHWQAGTPDLTRNIVATIDALDGGRIGPRGSPRVTRQVVDLGLTSTRQLRGLEYMPGDRRAVRAAFFTLERTGQWLGSWTPWYGFVMLPTGVAYRLPAGSRIIAEIHFSDTTDPVTVGGTLGLFLSDAPARTTMADDLVLDARSAQGRSGPSPAAAGVAARRVRAGAVLAGDAYALALRPDIAPGLRSIEVAARTPQGETRVLLLAKDPSVEWPTPYIFKEPVLLPKGTVLSVTGYFAEDTISRTAPPRLRVTLSRYSRRGPP
jgi:hypothetical protein